MIFLQIFKIKYFYDVLMIDDFLNDFYENLYEYFKYVFVEDI